MRVYLSYTPNPDVTKLHGSRFLQTRGVFSDRSEATFSCNKLLSAHYVHVGSITKDPTRTWVWLTSHVIRRKLFSPFAPLGTKIRKPQLMFPTFATGNTDGG